MIKVEDRVLHKTFNYSGVVVAYGGRLIEGNYLPTLKVRLTNGSIANHKIVVEDLARRWIPSNAQLPGQDRQGR